LHRVKGHFVGSAVELLQGFMANFIPIFLEDVRVTLSKQLDNPFIRYTSGAESSRVCRAEVVNSEIRNRRLTASCAPDSFD
jgi:hypothetical protein